MSLDDATHYHCRCGELFPIEEADYRVERDHEEFWGTPVVRDTIAPHCPHCGSDDPEPCFTCELCGIRRATEEGTDLCAICFALNEAEQDANVARAKELERELNQSFHWTDGASERFNEQEEVFHDHINA